MREIAAVTLVNSRRDEKLIAEAIQAAHCILDHVASWKGDGIKALLVGAVELHRNHFQVVGEAGSEASGEFDSRTLAESLVIHQPVNGTTLAFGVLLRRPCGIDIGNGCKARFALLELRVERVLELLPRMLRNELGITCEGHNCKRVARHG